MMHQTMKFQIQNQILIDITGFFVLKQEIYMYDFCKFIKYLLCINRNDESQSSHTPLKTTRTTRSSARQVTSTSSLSLFFVKKNKNIFKFYTFIIGNVSCVVESSTIKYQCNR
jgi:hypothetical protein